jgi:hypothetical protein
MTSLQVTTSRQDKPGHSSYSFSISHGGLLDEKIISDVLKLATRAIVSTILAQSSIRSGNSNTTGSQLLNRYLIVDPTNSEGIRQSADELGLPTLEQV